MYTILKQSEIINSIYIEFLFTLEESPFVDKVLFGIVVVVVCLAVRMPLISVVHV